MSASILLHIYPREIWQNVGDAALSLTVSDENYIATWDSETGERITYLEFDYSPSGRPLKEVSSAGFDDNSSQVRVVFSDSTVGLWDARSGVKKEMISEVENSSDSIRYYRSGFYDLCDGLSVFRWRDTVRGFAEFDWPSSFFN